MRIKWWVPVLGIVGVVLTILFVQWMIAINAIIGQLVMNR